MRIEETYQGIKRVYLGEDIYCYNLDDEFQCMAYKSGECKEDCPARIGGLAPLIKLYRSILTRYNKSGNYPDAQEYRNKVEYIKKVIRREQDSQIRAAYEEDKHRGSKGGSSESDSNNRASLKQKMKDNRPVECKLTSQKRADLKKATEDWEAENGKLPRLARNSMGRSKEDLYIKDRRDTNGKSEPTV